MFFLTYRPESPYYTLEIMRWSIYVCPLTIKGINLREKVERLDVCIASNRLGGFFRNPRKWIQSMLASIYNTYVSSCVSTRKGVQLDVSTRLSGILMPKYPITGNQVRSSEIIFLQFFCIFPGLSRQGNKWQTDDACCPHHQPPRCPEEY